MICEKGKRDKQDATWNINTLSMSLIWQSNYTYISNCSIKKEIYGPFLWMEFNCLKARATSKIRGSSLLFNTKFSTHKVITISTLLSMFHLISFSPHFNVHVSSYFLQSTVHLIHFAYHSPSHEHIQKWRVALCHSVKNFL